MDNFIKNCTGVILAGGENKRMPVLKAFIMVNGERIIERNLKVMKQLFKDIFIITNQPEAYLYLRIPLFGDVYNRRGPLTGIYTSLLNSPNDWVFVTACDMPFINMHLIRYMASKRDNHDIVAPRLKGRAEPLFAYYSRRLRPTMEEAILANKTSPRDFFINKRVKYIYSHEIKRFDPERMSFINLNTIEDINFYLNPKDRERFKTSLRRRKECLD
jgi:molybdopterin-guanine dinucleotide biosynthesis protein A